MNIVQKRVGVFYFQGLAHHHAQDIRVIIAAQLVQFHGLGWRRVRFAFAPFGNINEHIGQTVVFAHHVMAGGGDRRVQPGAFRRRTEASTRAAEFLLG